jgi:hypothetical protein
LGNVTDRENSIDFRSILIEFFPIGKKNRPGRYLASNIS